MKPPSEVTCESNHVARSKDLENGLPGGNSIKISEESRKSTNGSPTETEASSNNAANAPQSISTEEGKMLIANGKSENLNGESELGSYSDRKLSNTSLNCDTLEKNISESFPKRQVVNNISDRVEEVIKEVVELAEASTRDILPNRTNDTSSNKSCTPIPNGKTDESIVDVKPSRETALIQIDDSQDVEIVEVKNESETNEPKWKLATLVCNSKMINKKQNNGILENVIESTSSSVIESKLANEQIKFSEGSEISFEESLVMEVDTDSANTKGTAETCDGVILVGDDDASIENETPKGNGAKTCARIEGDDDVQINGKKRVLQESALDSGKKPKLIFPDEPTKGNDTSVELNINNVIGEKERSLYELYLQKSFKGLSKQILKEMLVQKFCETFAYNSCIGELRARAAQLEDENQRLNKISNTLRKQVSDSRHIIRRLLEERDAQIRSGRSYPLTPLRVTRSVGLQVCTSGTFLMRPKSLSMPSQNDKVIDLVSGEQSGVGKTASTLSKESGGGTKALNGSGVQENISGGKAALLVDRASTIQGSTVSTNRTPLPSTSTPTMVSQQPKPLASILAWTATPIPHASSQHTQASLGSGKSGSPPEMTQRVEQAPHTQPLVHVSVPNSPHYIIASPISSQALTKTTTVINKVNQVDKLKPLEKPMPVERAKQDMVGTTSNNTMEVIDLTEKDEKVLSNKTPNVLSPTSTRPTTSTCPTMSTQLIQLSKNIKLGRQTSRLSYLIPASAQQNQSTLIKVQKKRKTNSTLDVAKPAKFTSSGNSENQSDILKEKDDSSLIEAISKLPPLPSAPKDSLASGPPRPFLRIYKSSAGIMLEWSFGSHKANVEIATFELFAYQERKDNCPKVWNKVGEVKALPLPMACTLTQFVDGQKYHFAVRAIDVNDTIGEFSAPGSIVLMVADEGHE